MLFNVSLLALIIFIFLPASLPAMAPKDMAPPVEDDIWVRPAPKSPAEPVIGFKDGIRIALWPTRGPRGLIRIYTPYVFPESSHPLINFIAIEPVVSGARSLSELEMSKMDNIQGKRFWFSNSLDQTEPELPWNPARGKIGKIKLGDREIKTLSIVVNTETLDNGARPQILVTFREDRPNEVGFKVYSISESKPMDSCVLTATMGNYSRTRLLWLKDRIVDSRKLWPDYKGSDFVWTDKLPGELMLKDADGTLTAAITPSETDLGSVEMPPGGWRFNGKVSTQYWRKYPGTSQPDLRVKVNGRAVYWASQTPIPGGVSFENFELIEKFKPGLESWFGVTLKTPKEMGFKE